MRWNCPHCGVGLAISDEKVSTGWSFSRCYKCAGHALVRRSEINLIKVDKAPPGERVLLPEGSEEPMMSQNASDNYHRVVADPSRPTANRTQVLSTPSAAAVTPPQFTLPTLDTTRNFGGPLPDPLPESRFSMPNVPPRVLPVAMGVAGALAIGSGIYLYVQGMNLWNKARQSAPIAASESPIIPTAAVVQTDKVQTSAMAPSRSITVQSRIAGAKVYSGPGAEFSTIGVMDLHKNYRVSEWNERWFKVELDGRMGWVRNDLVQPVTANP